MPISISYCLFYNQHKFREYVYCINCGFRYYEKRCFFLSMRQYSNDKGLITCRFNDICIQQRNTDAAYDTIRDKTSTNICIFAVISSIYRTVKMCNRSN